LIRFFQRLQDFNVSVICFAGSAIALGHALQFDNGFYHPVALNWLTAAFLLAVVGLLLHRFAATVSHRIAMALQALLVAGIVWQATQLFFARPGLYITEQAHLSLFKAGIVAQVVLVAIGVLNIPALRRIWFAGLLATSMGLGVWMIKAAPDPYIDVVEVHKEAIEALIHHRDPYRISFANIYENAETIKFYNPDAIIGGRLVIAYPYPPASLLLVVPGHVLFGDYRYSELALLVAAAALIGFSRRGKPAQLAAALLLTTPRIWFVIEEGWSEPVALFMLALTVFLMIRNPIASGWAAGILVVTKQYLGFAGLAVVRLVFADLPRWKWTAISAVFAASAVTLPIALWHPNAFMRNVVWLQAREPFRIDSLSYLSWAAREGWGRGSFFWAIGAALLTAILSLFTTRNTAQGFAASVALITFAFFAFGSKAFCNYYFFVVGALCCAIAVFPLESDGARSAADISP